MPNRITNKSGTVHPEKYLYLPYLHKEQPVNINGKTVVYDEGSEYNTNRPELYKRCLLGNGVDTIDLSEGISGVLTLKGWVKNAPYKLNVDYSLFVPWLVSRATVTDNDDGITVTRINGGNTEDMYAQLSNLNLGWLSKMNNSKIYYEYEARSVDNLWLTININGNNTPVQQLSSSWVKVANNIGAGNSGNGLIFVINNNGSVYNTGTSVEIRNLKVWWENDGTELTNWDYYEDLPINSTDYTQVILSNNSYYKSIERYDDGVHVDTFLFEEGTDTIVYSDAGAEGVLSTEDLRTTDDDAPLLENSGDVVGYGFAKSLDMIESINNYFDGSPESLPYTPSTVLNSNRRLYTTPSLGGFRVQHRAASLSGDTSQTYIVDGKDAGFYSDSDGIYCWIVSNEAKPQSSFIEIESFVGDTIANGKFTFYYKTNNPFYITVWSYDFRDEADVLYNLYNNGTDDPNNHLGSNIVSGKPYLVGVYDFVNDPASNSSAVDAFNDLFLQYTNQDVNEFYANTVTPQRLDLNLRFEYSFIINVDESNRNIFSSLTESEFTHQVLDTANANRTSALAGLPLPPIINIQIHAEPAYNIAEYGGDGNDIELKFYFGNLRNTTPIPKDKNSNIDINGEDLIYSERKDYPLTPKDVSAFTQPSADAIVLNEGITIEDGSKYKFECLYNSYQDSSYSCMFGNSVNEVSRVGGFHINNFFLKATNTDVNVDTGLDVSALTDFIYSTEFTRNGTGLNNLTLELKNLSGDVLSSHIEGSITDYIPEVKNLTCCNSEATASKQTLGTFSWWKIYVDDVLTHHWVYTSENSGYVWDVVGGNHGQITSADLTTNAGVQDVYSYPLESGYNTAWSFGNSSQYQQVNSPVTALAQDGDYIEFGISNLDPNNSENYICSTTDNIQYINLTSTRLRIRTGVVQAGSQFYNTFTSIDVANIVSIKLYVHNGGQVGSLITYSNGSTSSDVVMSETNNPNIIQNPLKFDYLMRFNGTNYDGIIRYININGVIYTPDNPLEYSVDTACTELIPAAYSGSTDVLGLVLKYPSGPWLTKHIKLKAPDFRVQNYLVHADSPTTTNFDHARAVRNLNSSSHMLVKAELNNELRGFPCLKFNGVNTDYVKLKNAPYQLANNRSHKWEIWISDYNSLGSNTRQTVIGWDGYKPVYFGFRGTSRLFYYGGNSGIDVETSLTFSTLGTFYVVWEYTASPTYDKLATINLTGKIYNASGVLLFEHSESNYQVSAFQFDMFSLTLDTGTPLYPLDANLIKAKLWIDGELEADWQYTGNNSYLVQDVVGDNYGTITTSDIAANQGVQDVFNPLVDGNNKIVECVNYRINFYGAYNVIDYSKEWDLVLEGLGAAYSSGYQFAGPSANIRIQGNNLFIAASANAANRLVQFTGILPTSYDGEYVSMKFEFRDLGSNNAQITATININGNEYTQTQTQTTLSVNIPFDSYRIPNIIGNDSGYIQYYRTFNFTNVTDSLSYSIIENGVRIDTTTQLSEYGTSIKSIDILPQHPYNGLDVFGNALTTRGRLNGVEPYVRNSIWEKRLTESDNFELTNEDGDLIIVKDYKHIDHNG